ncbi:MAG: ABC transporter permease [Actinomycetota bacterium]|nr:MAG: ABC transporter permease [Actinomycetota bacterium]
MWAMIVKEFRQLRRDRRTLAMMIVLPVLMLVIFGYAANFTVSQISTVVVGPQAITTAAQLKAPFRVVETDPKSGISTAKSRLLNGNAEVAFITGPGNTQVLMDGTQLFAVETAETTLGRMAQAARAAMAPPLDVSILYNPKLNTSWVLVPGLAGLILVFIGTLITSLGVVRERQSGTLEQLAVMPLRPWDVIAGKIVPYFIVASLDLIVIIAVGILLFGVPFVGNIAVFALGAILFLLVTLGMGVLISTVSQNQGQAIQLAFMVMLPQILLSGLIFPIDSMSAGVRWISYILPLTYFIDVSRGVMLKGMSIAALSEPLALLAILAVVVLALAMLRFRRDLAPSSRRYQNSLTEPKVAA